ncbi:hypothetical protein LTR66_011636, partial [Elasticomyces elasticus]
AIRTHNKKGYICNREGSSMATTTKPSTPKTETLSLREQAPRTPTSIPPVSQQPTSLLLDNPYLLRPHSSHKPDPSPGAATSLKKGRLLAFSPQPLTGAAAMIEERRRRQQQAEEGSRHTSPNPAMNALNTLSGGGMSRATAAPVIPMSEAMKKVAQNITIPEVTAAGSALTSSVSASSFDTIDSTSVPSAMTATACDVGQPGALVAEPAQMVDGAPGEPPQTTPEEAGDSRAFTFPGSAVANLSQDNPARGMSLPMSGYAQNSSPKSPSAKRHKCPYCDTDFTRHHNLKSHLLTHSQEKPYVCQTCQARFRRLHDLKRHTKLHTGERPHTCPRCGRRFARGDALARHNKGPGGCAGRRSSFGADDDPGEGGAGDDDKMEGVDNYGDDGQADEDEQVTDPQQQQQQRRGSEPSRKRHLEAPADSGRGPYRQQSSTYPPIAGRMRRNNTTNMGPPSSTNAGSSTATSPRDHSVNASPAGSAMSGAYFGNTMPSVFAQGASMTESPKPLSPGQPDQHRLGVSDTTLHRNRSPSLTQQFQQTHFGRGTARGTPPTNALPPSGLSHPPQLPSLPGLAPADAFRLGTPPNTRAAPKHTPAMAPNTLQPQPQPQPQPPTSTPNNNNQQGSNPGSFSSHERSSAGSARELFGGDQHDMWAHVRALELRFSRMQDEYELRISRLNQELMDLRNQLGVMR